MTPPQNPPPSQYHLKLGFNASAPSPTPKEEAQPEIRLLPNGDIAMVRTSSLGGPFFSRMTQNSRGEVTCSIGIDLFKVFRNPGISAQSNSANAATASRSTLAGLGLAAAAHASLAYFLHGGAVAATLSAQKAIAQSLGF